MKTQLTLCISGTLLLIGMSGCEKTPERPMNVVYILADDLGYGDVGCYGQKIIKTPNIDRLAEEGMLFTQHYAGCTVSAPSRCSLMTGLHTGHTQVRGNREITPEGQQPMREDTYTLGKLMKSAGYTTGIFGKWGLGNPGSVSIPNKMGFDEFYGYNCQRQSHSFYPDHLWHNEEKVLFPENENNACKTYSQDLIHEQALKFIRDHKEQPFFAMLTYTLPHAELNLPHDSIYKMYENSFEETPYIGKFDKVYGGYNTSEKPLASFAAMVSRLDKYVGDVMAELKELGLDKNTIVIFTSDNGPWLTEHENGGSAGPLKDGKGTWWEGGFRVPAICWMPGKINPAINDEIMTSMDLYPTFLSMAGIEQPKDLVLDGVNQTGLLFEEKHSARDEVYYWWGSELMAIRKGEWKYYFKTIKDQYLRTCKIETPAEPLLYNVETDISERFNQAEKHPEIVKLLIEAGEKHKKGMKIKPSVCDMM